MLGLRQSPFQGCPLPLPLSPRIGRGAGVWGWGEQLRDRLKQGETAACSARLIAERYAMRPRKSIVDLASLGN